MNIDIKTLSEKKSLLLFFVFTFLQIIFANSVYAVEYLVDGYVKVGDDEGGFPADIVEVGDEFGSAVADIGSVAGGRLIAVGYAEDSSIGQGRGSVYTMVVNSGGQVVSYNRIADLDPDGGGLNNKQFGAAVVGVGDINGDGYADMAVGSPLDADSPQAGAVYIVFLDASGKAIGHQKISGIEGGFDANLDNNDLFGASLAATDIDGDGRREIIVGAPGDDDGAWYGDGGNSASSEYGALYVIFLKSDGTVRKYKKISALVGGLNITYLGDKSGFGRSVTGIGDLDNDGINDIAVSAPRASTRKCHSMGCRVDGRIYILFMNSDGTIKRQKLLDNRTRGMSGIMDGSAMLLGSGMSAADYDNDGVLDLVVGIHKTYKNMDGASALFVIYLETDGSVKGYQRITDGNKFLNEDPFIWDGVYAGDFIRITGDIDGNGSRDILVGAPDGNTDTGNGSNGSFYILFIDTVVNPAPTVSLVSDHSMVRPGDPVILTWVGTDINKCFADNDSSNSNWEGAIWESVPTGTDTDYIDSVTIPSVNVTTNFIIYCEGSGGVAADYVEVSVVTDVGPDLVVNDVYVDKDGLITVEGGAVRLKGVIQNIGHSSTDMSLSTDNLSTDIVDIDFQACIADKVGKSDWSLVTAQDILSIGLFDDGILNCDGRNIVDLSGISRLENAAEISFQHNNVSSLPGNEIIDMGKLSKLKIKSNNVSSIPQDTIQLMVDGEVLDLSYNLLNTLPVDIGNLNRVTLLDLSHNILSVLPPEVSGMTKLNYLDLNDNQLISLPNTIGALTDLAYIDVSKNQLSSLPDSALGQLSKLGKLYFNDNNVSSLDSSVGNLVDLMEIKASNNALVTLPTEIGNLNKLEVLDLEGNNINILPDSVGGMTALRILNLKDNDLTSLSSGVGGMVSLTNLNLEGNSLLNSIPDEIGGASSLITLNLKGGKLTTLPDGIGNLSNVVTVNANNNLLTSLPSTINGMNSLSNLYLNDNQIVDIVPEIGGLTSLIKLELGNNFLTTLPSEIGGLLGLQELVLGNNEINSLPVEVGMLPALKLIRLENNQLEDVPENITGASDDIYLEPQKFPSTFDCTSTSTNLATWGSCH